MVAMTFVRSVIAPSILSGSMFIVSGRTSTEETSEAPQRTNAVAVEVKVKEEGRTSSPGPTPVSIAAISRACVHDGVISTDDVP